MMDNNKVECGDHGLRRPAFVCQHLTAFDKVGFHEPFDQKPEDELEDGFQAWCDECEKIRSKEGEWNDVSEGFAKIKLVCDLCFFEMKKINIENN